MPMIFGRSLRDMLPYLVSIAVTLLLMCTGQLTYVANDDMAIISLLSGKLGLAPVPDGVYLAAPLGWVLHRLYMLQPALPWYGMLLYGCLLLAFHTGVITVLRTTSSLAARVGAVAALSSLYAYMLYQFTFTQAALFLWTMVSTHVAGSNLTDAPPKRYYMTAGGMLALAFLIRPDILPIELALLLPMLATFMGNNCRRRLTYILMPLVLAIVVNVGTRELLNNEGLREYREYIRLRTNVCDKVLPHLTETPTEALRRTGWSDTDFFMLNIWWHHDETVFGTEKLKTFLSSNAPQFSYASLETSKEALDSSKQYLFIALLGSCIVVMARGSNVPNLAKNGRLPIAAAAALTMLSICILTTIRFPMHIAVPIYASLPVSVAVFAPVFLNPARLAPPARNAIAVGAVTLLVILIVRDYVSLNVMGRSIRATKTYGDKCITAAQLLTGKDTIFVSTNFRSLVENSNPLLEFRDVPDYLRLPTGWLTGSPAYLRFIREHGLGDRKTVVPAMVDNPRVLFYFWDDPELPFGIYAEKLLFHLQERYGKLFAGRNLHVSTVLDCRKRDYGATLSDGLIFFTIATTSP